MTMIHLETPSIDNNDVMQIENADYDACQRVTTVKFSLWDNTDLSLPVIAKLIPILLFKAKKNVND